MNAIAEINLDKPPGQLTTWLEHPGSLTYKAEQLGYKARVEVLSEKWKLNLFERKIIMKCNGLPVWYACTLIPKQTYSIRAEFFKNLSTTPLGRKLFTDPSIYKLQCNVLQFSQIQMKKLEPLFLEGFIQSLDTFWGRASIFNVDSYPLYLTEIFLPEITRCA